MAQHNEIVRSMHVLREMLADRGVCTEVLDKLSAYGPDDVQRLMALPRPCFVVELGPLLRLAYMLTPKTKVQDIRAMLKEDENIRNNSNGSSSSSVDCPSSQAPITYIIVARDRPNAADQKRLAELCATQPQPVDIQLFSIKELQFNISKHVLVPRHEVMHDPAEVDRLVAQHHLKSKGQFPHILRTDPMARYLGLRSGQLVRITRISPTSGTHIVYRCCV